MRIYDAGALTHHWDNDARTVTDYTTTPPVVRPYTADENAAAAPSGTILDGGTL